MALRCNINRTGRMIRLIYGLLMIGAGGVALIFFAIPAGGITQWALAIFLLVAGIFAVFEAQAGWCAIRAMGLHTPW